MTISFTYGLFIKPPKGMTGVQEKQRIFARILDTVIEVLKCYHFNVPGNIIKDSGGFLGRFRDMFRKIAGHVIRDSGECSRRFRGKFKKITGNVTKDYGEYLRKFRRIFEKIPGKVWEYSGEIKKIPGNSRKKTISNFSEVAIFYTNTYK